MKKIFTALAALTIAVSMSADEGMWLLPLLEKMNAGALKEAGCYLTPDEIYNVNHSSLKDAIVQFGGGCTGEIISGEGLLVTNHHCGYSSIQGLSTDEHNYLMNGYWALSRENELPVPGLTVTFLKSMTDVTKVLEKGTTTVSEIEEQAAKDNPSCEVQVVNFYNDNVSYLIVYKVYRDIRFVGAPPASMGKFGGETDNWMWPRHTCDFSMFRVYAGPDNEPSEYSPENRPYRTDEFLKISTAGVQEGDYSMILGYPGRTQRFQTADQLEQMIATNRIRIDVRTARQDIMWEAMCADPSVQLKYASKYASSANGWKKWQGEELAFSKLDIIGREKAKEEAFMAWVKEKKSRQEAYGDALSRISVAVASASGAEKAVTLLTEAPYRIELVGLAAGHARGLVRDSTLTPKEAAEALQHAYRDYVVDLDRKEAVALLEYYRSHAAPENYLPSLGEGFEDFATMDIPAYVDRLFENSVYTSYDKLVSAIDAGTFDRNEDPAAVLHNAIMTTLMGLYPVAYGNTDELHAASKAFTAGLLDWGDGKPTYPDANFTMRLTYGHVLSYSPADAVLYRHYSTLAGVMEKEDPTNPEFIVPEKVKTLYEQSDYGRWADPDGTLHTCFLTNNDITGGNSGSPVLNARGELIGLAFDGNWESMSSDVMFEPDLQRCICVDIRYVLWMVEQFGGATDIINELTLVK